MPKPRAIHYIRHSPWTLDPANAEIVHFLSDVPPAELVSNFGRGGAEGPHAFQWNVSRWLRDKGFLTPKQRAGILELMANRNWKSDVVPFRPRLTAEKVRDTLVVEVCPGCPITPEERAALIAELNGRSATAFYKTFVLEAAEWVGPGMPKAAKRPGG